MLSNRGESGPEYMELQHLRGDGGEILGVGSEFIEKEEELNLGVCSH